MTFHFCLSTSTHFWTTSTDEVSWPQGDRLLGGGKEEKPEAQAEAKGNIEKQHPKKSIQCATMPLYDSRSIAEISFLRRLTTFQSPVGLFELEFCSTGTSVSFSSSLAGFAALCKLRYGPPSTLSPRRAMAPRFSLPLERTLEVHDRVVFMLQA